MTDDRKPDGQVIEELPDDDMRSVIEADESATTAVDDSPGDAVAAYLLDALDDVERREFEAFLAASPETQEEMRQLAPVVALLPRLFDIQSAEEQGVHAPAPEPRHRIATTPSAAQPPEAEVDEDGAEAEPDTAATPAVTPSRTIRTAPEVTGPFEHKRRSARPQSRPGTRPAPAPLASLSRFPPSWLIAAGLAIVAISGIIWALALQGRIDSKNREIAAQSERLVALEAEIAELRQNANATSFALTPASNQAVGATGTLLYSIQDSTGVLYVRDLPELDDDLVYQLWYLDDQSEEPRPGGTFQVDNDGNGFIVVEPDTPVFDGLAVTVEPDGGSEAPTSPLVLQGRLGGARG